MRPLPPSQLQYIQPINIVVQWPLPSFSAISQSWLSSLGSCQNKWVNNSVHLCAEFLPGAEKVTSVTED